MAGETTCAGVCVSSVWQGVLCRSHGKVAASCACRGDMRCGFWSSGAGCDSEGEHVRAHASCANVARDNCASTRGAHAAAAHRPPFPALTLMHAHPLIFCPPLSHSPFSDVPWRCRIAEAATHLQSSSSSLPSGRKHLVFVQSDDYVRECIHFILSASCDELQLLQS